MSGLRCQLLKMADTSVITDKPGVAKLKPEYILADYRPTLDKEFLSTEVKEQIEDNDNKSTDDGPPNKRIKLKGRNKQRPKTKKIDQGSKLCPAYIHEEECRFGEKCKFSHDIKKFVDDKLADIGSVCHLYQTFGKCPYGVACRFGKSHIDDEYKNVSHPDVASMKNKEATISNILKKDLQRQLWKRTYNFSKADEIINKICPSSNDQKRREYKTSNIDTAKKTSDANNVVLPESTESTTSISDADVSGDVTFENGRLDVPIYERKKIDFSNKLYLAPLTTVGNLPFRRVCKQLGADITCGEMAVCTNLLQGQLSEWALLKRHESEDLFGVQLCGGFPDSMTRCAQLVCENLNVDFIDINCGCPIDLIFNKGEGSALMGRLSKFESIIKGMKSVMDVPLTVKIRTGIYDGRNTADTLVSNLRDWGVAMTTLHGRSRTQRYTKTADWEYINECARVASPMPLFGNGDIMSYQEANLRREQTGVSGVMLARGALIKPWVFTEIKEQRDWDISSTERYDLLKDFVNYGFEHWGSDQQGVENTRRFLLEWLSFLYRYIPVGLLERLPQKINERPPYYQGRNDLETLMASPNCGDWIKISEMLLGPVPDGFSFLPKHKANAYK
ncbi:tRNA-dihydrouridine(47) synthase [NAD(P)(+)]-like protein [Mactra antiquata]